MHTLWLFLAWPDGGVWSNVLAMPLCGVLAGLAAYLGRDHLGRALRQWYARHFGHHAELDAIRARLDGHADALDLGTPGGLAAVMAEVRRAASASEASLAEVRALARIKGAVPEPAAPEPAAEKTLRPGPMTAGGPGTSGKKPAPGTGPGVTAKPATGRADGENRRKP